MDEGLLKILDFLAPGKQLRKGIDRIMEANLGALIFLASSPEKYLEEGLIQLGFELDALFIPEKIYELAKMDGAIVLDKNAEKILFANAQLNPEKSLNSDETGMRHRTAEKVSLQTGDITIAVSKRRNSVSVFYKNKKHELLTENILFARVNQEITIAQRYKQSFLDLIDYLNIEEVRKNVSLYDVAEIISKGMLTIKITQATDKYLRELGEIAGSSKLEYEEILRSVPKLVGAIIMDYNVDDLNYQKSEDAIENFNNVKTDDLVNLFTIARTLGYDVSSDDELEEKIIIPRGYRILYSTKLPSSAVKNVVDNFERLPSLMEASFEDLTNVAGIGKRRAEIILGALHRKKKETEDIKEKDLEVEFKNEDNY
ncbi:DNA integrity scanning diadenylate cyclase DisA [Oceanotoga sp. DSM 15011]|jgi:diadenylate cyclase|uniref:Diadenylate cyclase n=1 Tax=Oceanotoga teriensis TaxID=515440 RepID=A0AA45C603_9BACT|nr:MULTISPECIES: DNA integrity scanning diadenylate cyclase DisA [Oceanotoga]MDN5341778.1 diadenylate cyclase [Oceanotoga sp.]MDO7975691.1 DNA integrity scanning diadenylate cyclase DisA [Oceanotoga teriensis]PWJ90561.1 diadenylate cyclase [Oceanotoga teriensis]UYO99805.1 DNA integrity scanning diadenylate cyclase DisA [Oceanotoga sp. DSM 15011]